MVAEALLSARGRFDMKVMAVFTEVFQALPLAHLINKKVFVVHGGLPANTDTTMDDVAAIQRFREPPESGVSVVAAARLAGLPVTLRVCFPHVVQG